MPTSERGCDHESEEECERDGCRPSPPAPRKAPEKGWGWCQSPTCLEHRWTGAHQHPLSDSRTKRQPRRS